ncbi:hypothetical protein RRF57_002492 [Xylaria bambusicola]|uniref:Nephrocystin 3-like N-terminal domain-containing protein n=1 Tax=Xylaria bambusicola TaxID=326684 RepID=A0AAN7Z1V2_9PEZI
MVELVLRPAYSVELLHSCLTPSTSFVFVHGFTGHPDRTWRSKKRVNTVKSPIQESNKRVKLGKSLSYFHESDSIAAGFLYWPQDLLPGIVPLGRVLTFGYDTNIRHALQGPVSHNKLGDHSTDFLSALEHVRSQDSRRPLIFISHSLGGLLVKDALRLSKSYEHVQPERYHVYQSTTDILFFGTPHAGADPRNTLHKALGHMVKAAGFRVNNEIVQTLMPGAERSKLLAEDFTKWTAERNWNIYTFQEELAHTALGSKIVEDHSSTVNDPRHERIVHIKADHVDMCRFTGADDPEFRKVSAVLLRVQEQLLRVHPHPTPSLEENLKETLPDTTLVLLSPDQVDAMLEKLSFQGIDARYMTLKIAQRKTCQWLVKHRIYKSWVDPLQVGEHHGFLWIKGKPGTGKSIAMKYLYQNAIRAKSRLVLKFFFNARGNMLEYSTEGLYRSLLWQLLAELPASRVNSPALRHLCALDGSTSWPIETLKEAFNTALMNASSHEVYCFVDALDECAEDAVRDMISFFEDIGTAIALGRSKVRVCFSSRHYPHISISRGLQLILEDEGDHSDDIQEYIHSQLRINTPSRLKIEHEILEKSSKIFLWAALVVDIINKEHDKGGDVSVHRRLRQIPLGLHALFQDILTRDNENMEEMILCIQWILFAKRPLRPEELYFAMQIGNNSEASTVWERSSVPMERIHRFNLNASKGLTEVTKKEKAVQFIHESVRDYLLRERGLEALFNSQGSRMSFSHGLIHDKLRDICLQQLLDGSASKDSNEDKGDLSSRPFLEYAVNYILSHADSAQARGSEQLDFMRNRFPLRTWVILDNELQKFGVRRHTKEVNLLCLLAEKNLPSLIHIHPLRHQLWLKSNKMSRFSNPLVAAIYLGNNEAIFALAYEAAKGVSGANRPQDLVQVEKELRNMPQFTKALSEWKREPMDPFSAICSLGSTALLDMLWDHILVETGLEPSGLLSNTHSRVSFEICLYIIRKGAFIDTFTKRDFTVLMEAVKADALTTVKHLLAEGANPNISGKMGHTCLTLVKSSKMVRLLIEHGASFPPDFITVKNVNEIRYIPTLISGLEELPHDELRRFIKEKNNGRVAIRTMFRLTDHTTWMPLLKRILDIDGALATPMGWDSDPPLMLAILSGNIEAIKLIDEVCPTIINAPVYEWGNKETPLFAAIGRSTPAVVQCLLELGANPSPIEGAQEHSALYHSAWTCFTPLTRTNNFRTVLKWPTIDVNIRSKSGSTLLLRIVEWDEEFCARGFVDDKKAPARQIVAMIKLLLRHPRIDINLPNNDGLSPLLEAARSQSEAVVKLFLQDPRTDRTLKCAKGKSLLDYAKENTDPGVLQLIKDAQ